MRKFVFLAAIIVALTMISITSAFATCTKIQSGSLHDVSGRTITTGFDQWGYNYQAHMFNGLYANYTRPTTPVTTGDLNLVMKWSDNWISNQDCFIDAEGTLAYPNMLDRGGDGTGISKGWLTNHFEGDYEDGGEMYHYTEFTKIVYDNGAACGVSLDPPCLWSKYTIIEDVINDAHGGFHGVDKSMLVNPAGLGFYTNGN